ncbi:hypothetical protein SAMN04487898_105125 [Pedobacter sp. ok626]|uniref:hypothetical protein n=1 Tax=Pedobacter sp. ok626 TaxID=1761882 RepID=UPI0008847FC1|nr:hypothetical protein [Pedobacter sp. ok626]SDJ94768.1 hypothetical protein SAMN04487898_105125 [Pedobacter sp. ok626]
MKPNKALVVNVQGIVEVHVNWKPDYEPYLIDLIGRGVTQIQNVENIKYTVQFDSLARHIDTENPQPILFNNPELESDLEETYRNIIHVFG